MSTDNTDNLNATVPQTGESPSQSFASSQQQPNIHMHQPRMQQPTEGEEMLNPPTRVPAFGKVYEIRRFSMAQVFQSVEYVAPFGFVLQNILALPRDAAGNITATPEVKTQIAVTALSISGPSCLGLISVATGEPVEWLELPQHNPLDGLAILSAVLEKNLDFFTQENMDKLTALIGNLTTAVAAFSGKTSAT
jgi:hypothetical protein